MDPDVCPVFDPAGAPAVPAPPADPAVCNAAITTWPLPSCGRCAVGPGDGFALPLVHWSATLVALVTLNSLRALELVPAFAVAVPPAAVALEFCPEAEDV